MHLSVANEVMNQYLPEDPLPGQVVKVPDGVDGGHATHITLYQETEIVGESHQLIKVENVSRKWQLGRTVTSIPLKPETRIQVRAVTKYYASLMFVEYFGWIGHKYRDNETVHSDRLCEVIDTAIYFSVKDTKYPHIYEVVCLSAIDEGEKK